MSFEYEYERPGLTVDCVIFGLDLDEESLKAMLIERDLEPFAGVWAIPGGFVRPGETLMAAATRELEEETGIKDVFLEQLFTFGDPDRDPRRYSQPRSRELEGNLRTLQLASNYFRRSSLSNSCRSSMRSSWAENWTTGTSERRFSLWTSCANWVRCKRG